MAYQKTVALAVLLDVWVGRQRRGAVAAAPVTLSVTPSPVSLSVAYAAHVASGASREFGLGLLPRCEDCARLAAANAFPAASASAAVWSIVGSVTWSTRAYF